MGVLQKALKNFKLSNYVDIWDKAYVNALWKKKSSCVDYIDHDALWKNKCG